MIGGSGRLSRGQVDGDARADLRQGRGGQNVVDSPAVVSREAVLEKVPIGILPDVRIQAAKHIDKSPAGGLFVGGSGRRVKVRAVDEVFRIIDIDRFRSDNSRKCYNRSECTHWSR